MTHSSQECVVFAISYRLSNYNVYQKSKNKRYIDSTDYYSNYIPVQNVSFYLLSCVFRKKIVILQLLTHSCEESFTLNNAIHFSIVLELQHIDLSKRTFVLTCYCRKQGDLNCIPSFRSN